MPDFIRSYLAEPKVLAELEDQGKSGLNHFVASVPLDSGVGVAVAPDGPILPLAKLVLSIEVMKIDSDIPLRHLELGDRPVLVGDTVALGQDMRVVLHETDGKLSIVLEQRPKASIDGAGKRRA